MQTTKQISQQSAAGVEALAEKVELISEKQKFETLQQKVTDELELLADTGSDLADHRDRLRKIESLLVDLNLDDNRIMYLRDEIQKALSAVGNIRDILEDQPRKEV